MPWKRVRINKIPTPSKADIIYTAKWVLGTITVMTMFGVLGWNIFKPKTIIQTITQKTEKFKTRRCTQMGQQQCEVSVQQNTRIMLKAGKNQPHAHESVAPIVGCENLMVIDFKYPIDESMLEAIQKFPGIISTRNDLHRVVIHRPCLADNPLDSFWSWEIIWEHVEVVLTKHYTK